MLGDLEFQPDDLSGAEVRALVAYHLAGMSEDVPPESVHAFDIDQLCTPEVSFWSVWSRGVLVGCCALKEIDAERGELKSMRVAEDYLGRGVGRAMVAHLIAQARARGYRSLWLETGAGPAFAPAQGLYEAAGFTHTGPFAEYGEDPLSVYMTLRL
jgi:putative acetyltransferase